MWIKLRQRKTVEVVVVIVVVTGRLYYFFFKYNIDISFFFVKVLHTI